MLKGLLIVIVCLAGLAGCAKPPVEELTEVRRMVAHIYASGASRLAPEEYRIASEALRGAEEFVRQGYYRQAQQGLKRAEDYSARALEITLEKKQQHLDQQKAAREEKARLAAEQLLREQARQQAEEEKQARVVPQKPAPEPEPVVELLDTVEVAGDENLANISARQEVYQDPLLWPLIYKANRDQIKDPQKIFPGQVLLIPRDKTAEEREAARQEARDLNLF